ncbi:hypothetical protein AB0892_21155 [Streptomyces sp. NPDC005409]|uniref:hypothetical protein n=1 Tax=Streptomyces sp. NPDC005409 TaxID=3155342 RepID=UPI0034550338
MSDLAWVPQSCTLPTEVQPLRVAEWDALLAEHLTSVSWTGPQALRLVLAGGPAVEEQVRDLVGRESACCSFFTFTISPGEAANVLDVRVEGDHQVVLEALAVRAGAAGATP